MVGEWSDYNKSILISTKVEVVVEVGFEKFLILNFHGRLVVGGIGLDHVGLGFLSFQLS